MLAMINQTTTCPARVQETAIVLLGELARLAREEDLGDVLELLLQRLGSQSAPLRSAAYTQVCLTAPDRRSMTNCELDFESQSGQGRSTLQSDLTISRAHLHTARQECRAASRHCGRDHVTDRIYPQILLCHDAPIHDPSPSHGL
jgi:hypothetical protein